MKNTYDDYAFMSYFGEFYDEYVKQAQDMLDKYDWQTIEDHMDPELREKLQQDFDGIGASDRCMLAYIMAHTEKFGEDFAIN